MLKIYTIYNSIAKQGSQQILFLAPNDEVAKQIYETDCRNLKKQNPYYDISSHKVICLGEYRYDMNEDPEALPFIYQDIESTYPYDLEAVPPMVVPKDFLDGDGNDISEEQYKELEKEFKERGGNV